MARKVIVDGKEYEGLAAAARALQTDSKIIRRRIEYGKEGYAWGEENTERRKGGLKREVFVNGQKHESMIAAARVMGVSRQTILTRLQAKKEGYEWGELSAKKWNKSPNPLKKKKPVMVEGVEYASIGLAVKATGISYNTITRRAALQVDGYKFL